MNSSGESAAREQWMALWRFITRRPMRFGAYSFTDVVVHQPVNKYHDGERWVLCNNKWGFGVVVPCEPPNVFDGNLATLDALAAQGEQHEH